MASTRRAFTTIELAIVLVLAAAIAAITIPSILPAMRKSAVNKAADAILAVAEEARRRARAMETPESVNDSSQSIKAGTAGATIRSRKYDYGVKVEVPADASKSAKVYLTDSTGSEVIDATTNKPVMERLLGSNVLPFTTAPTADGSKLTFTVSGLGTSIVWYYLRGTGQCYYTNALAEIGSGVQAGGTPDFTYQNRFGLTTASIPAVATPTNYPYPYFGVSSINGRYGVGIAIFCSGLGYSQEISAGQ